MSDFVHLHLHTQYSLLDGAADIDGVIECAKKFNMNSVAITDHGVMYGVMDFYFSALKSGVKPIIGCEVYTSLNSRFERNGDKKYGHLVLLCENNTGYKNLIRLVTQATEDGFYYKPRVDTELLKKYGEGLIALSGCLRGDVASAYLESGYEAAFEKAKLLSGIFGSNNFFLEVQNHGIPEEEMVRECMKKLSRDLKLPLVATNDVHYVEKKDAETQDVLMCIQTGKKLSDPDRLKMKETEYWFKSDDDMKELFADMTEATENTLKIAKRCNVYFDTDKMHLPKAEINASLTHEEYLEKLCMDGIKKKYKEPDENIFKRLHRELDVINKMGFTDYFLIVYDFIKYAKDNGIPVGPGRGSAAGSIVSYALNITEIDPIKYGLIFERFLNIERVTMPDIDIDFCYRRRDEVREYVIKKYGSERVAQIITFGTLAARAAVKDVGRVLGISPSDVNAVTRCIPSLPKIMLRDAIENSYELKKMYEDRSDIRRMIDIALKIEGYPRNASTHAAGIVISDRNLTDYVPLQKGDSGFITQYGMSSLEKIGLLKMDFLGLRNLTVIDDAYKLISLAKNADFDISKIPYDDEATFNLIKSGDTDAVFQLENPGLQSFLRKFKPKYVEDIIITTSIYRPGPMDQIPLFLKNYNNPKEIKYAHPLLKPILEPTYGVVVYQEQVMQIVRTLAGYSLGRADIVRRAMSKKKQDVMLAEREVFIRGQEKNGKIIIAGALRRGVDEKCANEIFDSLTDFAKYAFNKSHAACYAHIAYTTAYLKAHYPVQYLAAVLKNYAGYQNKALKYISSFSKYGIRVLKPDINKSRVHFNPEGNNVRFGFCWIKNVGTKFPYQIESEREERGTFISFTDFIKRMCRYDLNKRCIEYMIKSGCFDSLYPNRRVLLYNYEKIIDRYSSDIRNELSGQLSWFADTSAVGDGEFTEKNIDDFSKEDRLSFEYECTGMYFTGHPLDPYRFKVEAFSDRSIASIVEDVSADSSKITVCGRISGFSVRRTKSGKILSSFKISDFSGFADAVAFEKTLSKCRDILKDGSVIQALVTVNFKDGESVGELNLISARLLDEAEDFGGKSLYLRIDDMSLYETVKNILEPCRGESKVYIYFGKSGRLICSDEAHGITLDENVYLKLCDILGSGNVKIKK